MRPGWFDVHFDLGSKVFRLQTQDSCFCRNDNRGVIPRMGGGLRQPYTTKQSEFIKRDFSK
jgi:hypothetical protein